MRLWELAAGTGGTRFAYDGVQAIAQYDTAGGLWRRYAHGAAFDEHLVQYQDQNAVTRRFLHADERGSIIATSDSSGAVTSIETYDEYGKRGAGNQSAFGYTGQMWFPQLGLWHYKSRMYAPHLGRFLQPDPIGYDGGMNLYAYVRNDPVNLVDPLGRSWVQVGVCGPVTVNGVVVSGLRACDSGWQWQSCGATICDRYSAGWGFDWGPRTPREQEFGSGGGCPAMVRGCIGLDGAPASAPSPPRIPNRSQLCPVDRNINVGIDAGIFLGYGGGFSLGFNYSAGTGALSAFASVRVGSGLGWIAGAGVAASSSAPSAGLTSSRNIAAGLGIYGGGMSTSSTGTAVSGGVSYGPRAGAEVSNTENLTATASILGARNSCQ